MKQLSNFEISQINGGCEEHCWGDFEFGGLMASIGGGMAAGAFAGPTGIGAGALGGAVTYILDVMWTD